MKAFFVAAIVVAAALMVWLAPARANRSVDARPAIVQPAPSAADEAGPTPEALGPGMAESAYAVAPMVLSTRPRAERPHRRR